MNKAIKTNFYKVLSSYGFYTCLLFTIILCFTTEIYEDLSNGNHYSVIKSLIYFNRDFMLSDSAFSSLEIIISGAGSWLSMFIPIIAAFPFITNSCDESDAKAVRFQIIRSGKHIFYVSRYIVAIACGGLGIMMGYIFFCIIVVIIFPGYNAELAQFFQVISIKIMEMFVYGCVNSVPAVVVAGVSRNKYISLCVPFFLKYSLNQMCQKSTNIEFANSDIITYMERYGGCIPNVILYNMGMVFIGLVLYWIIGIKRTDSGE